jgi:hypothetical protein
MFKGVERMTGKDIVVYGTIMWAIGFGIGHFAKEAQKDFVVKTEAVCFPEEEVTKANGFGTRSLEYGNITHAGRMSRAEAEKFLRELNKESVYVKQQSAEYELVELFYRRVE